MKYWLISGEGRLSPDNENGLPLSVDLVYGGHDLQRGIVLHGSPDQGESSCVY
jgi:hypothetical protein